MKSEVRDQESEIAQRLAAVSASPHRAVAFVVNSGKNLSAVVDSESYPKIRGTNDEHPQ